MSSDKRLAAAIVDHEVRRHGAGRGPLLLERCVRLRVGVVVQTEGRDAALLMAAHAFVVVDRRHVLPERDRAIASVGGALSPQAAAPIVNNEQANNSRDPMKPRSFRCFPTDHRTDTYSSAAGCLRATHRALFHTSLTTPLGGFRGTGCCSFRRRRRPGRVPDLHRPMGKPSPTQSAVGPKDSDGERSVSFSPRSLFPRQHSLKPKRRSRARGS